MFNNPYLLRAVAKTKDEREQLDKLLRLSAPHENFLLAATAMFILALVAWLFLGSVARSVTAGCLLIEPGERLPAASAEAGQLIEFLVAPSERVEAGQPLARQSVPELDRETEILRDRVNLLQAELSRAGAGDRALNSLLTPAREALLQIEAGRTVRESIVSGSEGEVMDLLSAPGAFVSAGTVVALIRAAEDLPARAVLRVGRDVAQRIQPGMQATVEIPAPDGGARRIVGEVSSVTAGPLPDWLAGLEPAVPVSSDRVDIALLPDSDPGLPDGTACRADIEIGKHSPAALFGRELF